MTTRSTASSRTKPVSSASSPASVVVVIAGPNGAGKTTYAEALLGRQGGHGLEADVVKRRFGRSARNFLELYLPLARSWAVSENPRGGDPIEVASGAQGSSIIISDEQRWLKLHRIATNARS
jgi:predicted ABC-type ATPase